MKPKASSLPSSKSHIFAPAFNSFSLATGTHAAAGPEIRADDLSAGPLSANALKPVFMEGPVLSEGENQS